MDGLRKGGHRPTPVGETSGGHLRPQVLAHMRALAQDYCMPRPPQPRTGTPLRVKGRAVEFSRWPTKRGRLHQGLQSHLFALDPWGVISQRVKAIKAADRRDEALAYLAQAQDYYVAAEHAGLAAALPVLQYYGFMNLAKAFCLERGTIQSLLNAKHGISEKLRPNGAELTDAFLRVQPSRRNEVSVFSEFQRALTGAPVGAQVDYDVLALLPQIVPGHRLWAQGAGVAERFISVGEIRTMQDANHHEVWLSMMFYDDDLSRLSVTHGDVLNKGGLAGFRQVAHPQPAGERASICFEQANPTQYVGTHPLDVLPDLYDTVAPYLWTVVSSVTPYRRHYVYVAPQRADVLPQLLSIYATTFYLGSITRYRPHHLTKILGGPFGPRIREFILGQSPQFLYLLASTFARQDVTRPAVV